MTDDIHHALPQVRAQLRHDHSAEVVYNGGLYQIQGAAPDDTRERVVHYITYVAEQMVGGAVAVRLTDPDGTGWRFVVHPDGQVTDEAAAPAEPHLPPEPQAPGPQPPAGAWGQGMPPADNPVQSQGQEQAQPRGHGGPGNDSPWAPPPATGPVSADGSGTGWDAPLEETVIRRSSHTAAAPQDGQPAPEAPVTGAPAADTVTRGTSTAPDGTGHPAPPRYPAGAVTHAFRQDPGTHATWSPEPPPAHQPAAQHGYPADGQLPDGADLSRPEVAQQPEHPHAYAPHPQQAYPQQPHHPQPEPQQGHAHQTPVPPGAPEGPPPQGAMPLEGQVPPEEAVLRRRDLRASFLSQEQAEAPASTGVRGALTKIGIRTQPGAAERAERADVNAVSQHWPGVRTVAVVNGKGGANKTPTTALLSAVFARHSGAATLAWDNNETRGTLGWRTDQGHHAATVLDLIPEVDSLLAPGAKAGDISHFVHHQAADKYDVLRSNPNLLSSEQRISGEHVDQVHDVAGRYYRLIFVDSGNDESAGHWLRIIDKADQIVVATIAKPEHAEAGALLLEALAERGGQAAELARNAVVVVSQAREKDGNPTAAEIAKGFADWTREVVTIPYDPAMVESVLRFDSLRPGTQRAWLRAGAAVAAGL